MAREKTNLRRKLAGTPSPGAKSWSTYSGEPTSEDRGGDPPHPRVDEPDGDRHRAEAAELAAQRMELMGRLAGGIAHDFNNLLTVIMGCSEILLDRMEDDGTLRPYVMQIHDAGDRGRALIRLLLAYARRQVLAPRVVDLNDLVLGTQEMLRRLIPETIELVAILGQPPARIRADPGQIEQVIVNLVVNARDAMPDGGQLRIGTSDVHLKAPAVHGETTMPPGRYVLLSITDTGCGMDEGTRAHIFEPFFTTKGPGRGTGLGLATVHGIVKQSDGYIWASSEPDRGSTFEIYLPAVSEKIPLSGAEPDARQGLIGRSTRARDDR